MYATLLDYITTSLGLVLSEMFIYTKTHLFHFQVAFKIAFKIAFHATQMMLDPAQIFIYKNIYPFDPLTFKSG